MDYIPLFERAQALLGIEQASGQLAAQNRAMRGTESGNYLFGLCNDGIAPGGWICGKDCAAHFSKRHQRAD